MKSIDIPDCLVLAAATSDEKLACTAAMATAERAESSETTEVITHARWGVWLWREVTVGAELYVIMSGTPFLHD